MLDTNMQGRTLKDPFLLFIDGDDDDDDATTTDKACTSGKYL